MLRLLLLQHHDVGFPVSFIYTLKHGLRAQSCVRFASGNACNALINVNVRLWECKSIYISQITDTTRFMIFGVLCFRFLTSVQHVFRPVCPFLSSLKQYMSVYSRTYSTVIQCIPSECWDINLHKDEPQLWPQKGFLHYIYANKYQNWKKCR